MAKRWDVAISFASADEGLAIQLRDALSPPHSVFVYSKAQEDLAGRDGIEAFRTVFREQASLVVILYAEPWGQTPWTRVEETAIKELALDEGWEHLMFVRLKGDEPVPKWVPKPHLYMNLATFTLADLVGAIKGKLAELGVEIKPVTPAERAAAQKRKLEFDNETVGLLRSGPASFNQALQELFSAVEAEASTVMQETGWDVGVGPAAVLGGFMVTAQGQSVQIVNLRRYTNDVDNAALELREFNVGLHPEIPGQRRVYLSGRTPEPIQSRRIPIRRSPELGWCWQIDGRLMTPREAAKAVVHTLLDRVDAQKAEDGPGYGDGHREPDDDSFDPDP